MSTAIAHAPIAHQTHQVVCYRCEFVGMEAGSSRCPLCNFPLIVEALGDAVAQRVREIFARDSVNDGAPPLPGVDASPRKAQLLAEARKRRITEQRERVRQQASTSTAAAHRATARRGTGTSITASTTSRLGVAFAVGGALVAGLVAAVLVHGGI
jgi:hypothetical protein